MEPEKLLRFPTILSDSSCVKQDITQTSVFIDLDNTMLANPAMDQTYHQVKKNNLGNYKSAWKKRSD